MANLNKVLKQVKHLVQLQQRLCIHTTPVNRTLTASVQNQCVVIDQHSVDKGCNNEHSMKFPRVWLRDNCQCPECFHASSKSRKINWAKFDPKVKIEEVKTNDNCVNINWSDKHKSSFPIDWLKERDFNSENRKKYLNEFYRPKSIHWGKNDFDKILKTFDYKAVMEDDKELRRWLEHLAIYGAAMIKNSELERTTARKLADRVGFIRKTTYGEEFFVEARPGAKNYAYLSSPLQLHTDLPYYEYKPGVNLLHCLVQSKSAGGQNMLSDAFYAIDILKEKYPKYFETLTKTYVDWNDIGEDGGRPFHNIWRSPVICLDNNGNYTRINHSIPQRDSHFNVSLEEVEPWYEAYSKFVELIHQEAVTFKTTPGDIFTFNNMRMTHGRTGYNDSEQNIRCMVGAFLDWDIIYSKLRVLIKNENKTNYLN